MKSQRRLILILASGAAIAASRHANPETAPQAYDVRRCVAQRLSAAGFRTQSLGSNALSGEIRTIGALNREEGPLDHVHVVFNARGFEATGWTLEPDVSAETQGARRVGPTSARVTRTIEDLRTSCPVASPDTTGSR